MAGLLLIFTIAFQACSKKTEPSGIDSAGDESVYTCTSQATEKGSRRFGMDILNQYSGGSYATDFQTLKSIGGSYQILHLTWSSLEGAGSGITSGSFTDPSNALQTFSNLANSDGIKLALTIRPIDATGKTVPSDLSSTRFSAANMKTRFKALIDYIITRIPQANLVSIMIGNEIDDYNPGSDTNFWFDYGDFLSEIRSFVNTNYSGLPIGFTATFGGISDTSKTLAFGFNSVAVMQTYANLVDAVGVTYYPMNTSFTPHEPTLVAGDFAQMISFTAKPIHIQEIGYASSSVNSSSEYQQAYFFCEVFKAWDANLSRIPNMAALRLNDVSKTAAESLAGPYGITAEAFIEFLRTLGVRTETGNLKQSFSIIKTELQKRSF